MVKNIKVNMSNSWGGTWDFEHLPRIINNFLVISANEALNFIMVIIIKNGFQVDVEIGGYFTKMISHPALECPYRPQKRTL